MTASGDTIRARRRRAYWTSVEAEVAAGRNWGPFGSADPQRPVRCADGFARPASQCVETPDGWVSVFAQDDADENQENR